MWLIGAGKMRTNTFRQLLCREQSIGFDNMLLRMHAYRLNGIEPGTFGRQQEGQNADGFTRGREQLVMLPDPGAHHQAFMPRGIVPDQQPVALALSLQALAAPVQEQNAHRADGTPRDETQPEFRAIRLLLRSLLPQDAVARQRLGVGVPLLPGLLHQTYRTIFALPRLHTREREATPPDFVEEADGPVRLLAGVGDQSITTVFFPSGQSCRLSSSSPALFEASEQGLT